MGTLVEITSHGDQAGLRIVRLRHPMPDDRLYQRTLSERLQEITRFEHLRPPTPLQAILRNPVKAPALFFQNCHSLDPAWNRANEIALMEFVGSPSLRAGVEDLACRTGP